jgi:hypothetical protein
VIFGEGLENFEKAFFHADAGLNALDEELRFVGHGINVPWYICNDNSCLPLHAGDAAKPPLYGSFIYEKIEDCLKVHTGRSYCMCRNIKTLFNFDPPVTADEVRAASLQFVRKISGFNKPSKSNEAAFLAAVDEVAAISTRLLHSLDTNAPPKNREEEAAKAKARAAERFGA